MSEKKPSGVWSWSEPMTAQLPNEVFRTIAPSDAIVDDLTVGFPTDHETEEQ